MEGGLVLKEFRIKYRISFLHNSFTLYLLNISFRYVKYPLFSAFGGIRDEKLEKGLEQFS
jgi:hypothetical protein